MWKSFISSISGLLQPLGTMLGIRAFGGKNAFNSWMRAQTQSGLTGQQVEANQMQMQNWREQTQSQYGLQVQGMQDAGLNPALMYQSGAGSAPSGMSAPSQGQAMSMSDLAQMMLVDKQSKLLEAEIRNKDADTNKKGAETEYQKLITQYYPSVTETNLQKTLSAIGVDNATIQELLSRVDLNQLDSDLKEIQIIIDRARADEASAFYKATRELEEAKTETEKAQKRALVAKAFMDEVEGKFMKDNSFKMGSSEILSIAAALADLFGSSLDEVGDKLTGPAKDVWTKFKSWFKNNYQHGEKGTNIFGVDPD